ncbi:MAG TPA: RNA-binding domain-containing protein [Methanofastidiosum sp.]|nr:RNA-binding domain-containing protein [Methanofastidiosum sp.]HPA49570.1 RNA-binding domain-containing protein [Methanofastidiosum sp.]HQK62307.1 RNA-binding domain-containing protein [Methanofastidiosum sp.]HQQ48474.1 RNA-binding domain-containing protein [Methanofastidiosum sp.]
MDFKIKVSAEIKSTENLEKVKKSILNIFPDLTVEERDNEVIGSSEEEDVLSRFIELTYSEAIRDSVNMVLKEGSRGNKISFSINKQAAYAERLNLSKESPLGPIRIKIYVEEPYDFIDKMIPRTI